MSASAETTPVQDPLSLLIVNPMGGDGWGGVERWLTDVACGLRDRGHRVSAAGRAGSAWTRRTAERGFPMLEIPLRTDFHLGQAWKLSRFMLDQAVDVVATKLHRGIRAAGFAAKLAGAPPVVAFMGLVETRTGRRYRLTYDLFLDRVVTLTDSMAAEIVQRGALEPDSVEVIPYGVVPEKYVAADGARARVRAELGLGEDTPLALAIGRLNMQKRYDVMLDTFRRLRERLPEARLAIAGTGKLEPDLHARCTSMGLDEMVRFLGFRRDVGDLLAACDCLVLSSDDEGLPHVILEAMAAGRAVVGTAVGSVDDLVVEGENGLLVPRRDPEALCGALSQVLGSRVISGRMGAAGAARVRERYPLDLCLDRTEEYLVSLRAAGGAASGVGAAAR